MAWNDRISEAAYTSPSGIRITGFSYEDVSREFDRKTEVFEFPDADGSLVQDNGVSGRRYPLRLFFNGDDHDLDSDLFIDAISERGEGILEHPRYGAVNVVPFGKISQRDDLKTAANQTVIQITFFDTISLIYPAVQSDPASAVLTAIDEYNASAAAEFEGSTSLGSSVDAATFKNDYLALLGSASSGLQDVAATQDDVRTQFNVIVDSINQGIDILVSEPLTLAFQTAIMIQTPAMALTSITARLYAYNNLANSIIVGDDAVATPSLDNSSPNTFHTKDLYASTYVAGSVVSVVNNQFTTKTEALAAADAILSQMEAVTNWRDDNFESLGEVDTGAAYQQLQEAVALTAGFLVEISFTLKQERSFVLTHARTIIDLVAEFYGSVDDQLDFFINSNNLSGSEILEVPKGREIVYYI